MDISWFGFNGIEKQWVGGRGVGRRPNNLNWGLIWRYDEKNTLCKVWAKTGGCDVINFPRRGYENCRKWLKKQNCSSFVKTYSNLLGEKRNKTKKNPTIDMMTSSRVWVVKRALFSPPDKIKMYCSEREARNMRVQPWTSDVFL